MASVASFRVFLPNFVFNSECKSRNRAQIQCSLGHDSSVVSSDSVVLNGASVTLDNAKIEPLINGENGRLGPKFEEKKKTVKDDAKVGLEVLWDDGYGTDTVKDYLEISKEMIRLDGGPPRWFCPVSCGQPLQDSPVLLFLPGNKLWGQTLKEGLMFMIVLEIMDTCRWLIKVLQFFWLFLH